MTADSASSLANGGTCVQRAVSAASSRPFLRWSVPGVFAKVFVNDLGNRCARGREMCANGEERLEAIRRELQAILEGGKRITERDLLRLSAQTGIDYSTVVRIQQELS